MHGARRVVVFCILVGLLPIILLVIPLHLRHNIYSSITYEVVESDIIEIKDGISTVFCQKHSLEMNTTFSAFQIKEAPKASPSEKKHLRLKKSMTIPDDTLEYWGFFLPSGSTVSLSLCSSAIGARLLIVKGERNLRKCSLKPRTFQDDNINVPPPGQAQVVFTIRPPSHIDKANIIEDTGAEIMDDEVAEASTLAPVHYRRRREQLEAALLGRARPKRLVSLNQPSHKLDGGISHGGNVQNVSLPEKTESSESSFEQNLLTCYGGHVVHHQKLTPSTDCSSPDYLSVKHGEWHAKHTIESSSYYNYIFYSDNDEAINTIHVIFDINKPTFMYGNHSVSCINKTECSFPIGFLSSETVIVEVPTRDGIESGENVNYLISKCHPRSLVYAVFPIAVLFLILACSFL